MWISFAEPFVVPLARPEERTSKKTHLGVPSLFIRSPRSAVCVRDPVVHAVQAQFAPGEIGSEPDRLACNAATVEIVAPDEDAALSIAPHPVDVEDSSEADGLVAVCDGPLNLRLIGADFLEVFLLMLLGELAEPRSPESPDLGLGLPDGMQFEVLESRGDQRYAVPSFEPRAEHQRVASAASGGYSRSALQRSCQVALSIRSLISSTYAPSRQWTWWPRPYSAHPSLSAILIPA